MPVFPEVGSRMIRSGVSSPEASAASIIRLAIRSLTEPDGFCPSSLAHSRTPGFGDMRGMPTSGVFPIASRMSPYRIEPVSQGPSRQPGSAEAPAPPAARRSGSGAAGDGRQDRDRVALLHGGLERAEVPHVLVVHVDVDEAVQAAVVRHDVLGDPGVPTLEVREQLAERAALGVDEGLPAGAL